MIKSWHCFIMAYSYWVLGIMMGIQDTTSPDWAKGISGTFVGVSILSLLRIIKQPNNP